MVSRPRAWLGNQEIPPFFHTFTLHQPLWTNMYPALSFSFSNPLRKSDGCFDSLPEPFLAPALARLQVVPDDWETAPWQWYRVADEDFRILESIDSRARGFPGDVWLSRFGHRRPAGEVPACSPAISLRLPPGGRGTMEHLVFQQLARDGERVGELQGLRVPGGLHRRWGKPHAPVRRNADLDRAVIASGPKGIIPFYQRSRSRNGGGFVGFH